jgi:hypothetical protein
VWFQVPADGIYTAAVEDAGNIASDTLNQNSYQSGSGRANWCYHKLNLFFFLPQRRNNKDRFLIMQKNLAAFPRFP